MTHLKMSSMYEPKFDGNLMRYKVKKGLQSFSQRTCTLPQDELFKWGLLETFYSSPELMGWRQELRLSDQESIYIAFELQLAPCVARSEIKMPCRRCRRRQLAKMKTKTRRVGQEGLPYVWVGVSLTCGCDKGRLKVILRLVEWMI